MDRSKEGLGERIRNNLRNAGITDEEYLRIEENIRKKNEQMLKSVTVLMMILLFLLFAASFLVTALEKNRLLYGSFLLVECVIAALIWLSPKTERLILVYYYTFLILAYVFAIILGGPLMQRMPATTFCVLLFALPLLIIDRPYRISLLLTGVTLVFCIVVTRIKGGEVASLDKVNALSFLFLCVAVNYFVMKTKISEILNRTYIEKARDTDDLTRLMTKAAAMREIDEYIHEKKGKAALLVIDIDNFKNVNDQMGHAYGDAVLRIMGECIQRAFRESDILARFGGDEFVLFLPGAQDVEVVRKRVDRLVNEMNTRLTIQEKAYLVTGSIGIAFYPDNADNYEELFRKADEALYCSKGKGKNCYTFYFDREISMRS